MIKKTFKEKWHEKDICCPFCGQVTEPAKGLTKQNVLKLFRKPTAIDLILFIIITLTIFGAYAYRAEILYYKELIKHPQELCQINYQQQFNNPPKEVSNVTLTNISITTQDETT